MNARVPEVTIGIPVYNGERFLSEAIESVLAQSFTDFEALISDNASTDGTADICREYARRDPRVRYVRQASNIGAAPNFNDLVRRSSSPLFAWHAADDLAAPGHLETCVAALNAAPGSVIGYTTALSVDERGTPVASKQSRLPLSSADVCERFAACLSPIPYAENALYGVMRRSVMEQTGLLGPFGGSDRAFLAEMSLYGAFVRVDSALFSRRVPDVGKTEAELQRYNSGSQGRVALREWRILRWNARSVWRAPVPAGKRLALYAAMGRRLLTQRRLYAAELKTALKALAVSA